MFTEYDIKFVNLKFGKYNYHYKINSDFFKKFENSLINEAEATINLTLDKQSESLFLLNFELSGLITFTCDRCLKDINYPFYTNHKMILKVTNQLSEEKDDNVINVLPHYYKINIAEHIYEFIIMQVPLRKTCELVDNHECEKLIINTIDVLAVNNKRGKIKIDPRWESLKKLK